MKTNVTCSLDTELVARLDAWRAKLGGQGRSAALDLLLQTLPDQKMLDVAEQEAPPEEIRTDLALRSNGELIPVEEPIVGVGASSTVPDAALRPSETDHIEFLPEEVLVEEPEPPAKRSHKKH